MLRVATFNVENLDDKEDTNNPTLEERVPILRAAFDRMNAEIICLQEVHGQELPEHTSSNPKRVLSALDAVCEGTKYAQYHRAHTHIDNGMPYDQRNLVIMSAPHLAIQESKQYHNDLIKQVMYRKITASPAEENASPLSWERPILHCKIDVPGFGRLHVINLHLKSRLASNVSGQKKDRYSWKTAGGWAEGYFISSIKRVGQAIETRQLVDSLFEKDASANVLVCGDFNAEPGQVPVEAICGSLENTNNSDLHGTELVPCSRGIPQSIRYSHLHHGDGNLLDHMLMSQSLLAYYRQAEIHNENLHDESLPYRYDKKFPEADHAAFVSTFDISVNA